jgi:hypothetical protein
MPLSEALPIANHRPELAGGDQEEPRTSNLERRTSNIELQVHRFRCLRGPTPRKPPPRAPTIHTCPLALTPMSSARPLTISNEPFSHR